MAYELNWSFLMNQQYNPTSTLDASRQTIWWKCSALVGGTAGLTGNAGNWTLYASSDSVTAGIDSTDRWLLNGTYTGSKLVRAASGVHSWIVLRSPSLAGSYWYLTWDFLSGADQTWVFYMSKTAPTGGTTSLRPTSTDEWTVSGSSSFTVVNSSIATTNSRNSLALSTRGDFWCTQVMQALGYSEFFQSIQLPSGYNASDTFPLLSYIMTGTSSPALSTIGTTGTVIYCRRWTGTANMRLFTAVGSSGLGNIADSLTNNYIVYPLHWFCHDSGGAAQAYRGRQQDLGICAGAPVLPQGAVVNDGASVGWSFIGNFLVPANAAILFT